MVEFGHQTDSEKLMNYMYGNKDWYLICIRPKAVSLEVWFCKIGIKSFLFL